MVVVTGRYAPPAFPQAAEDPARLTYSRTFKGSTPEYVRITVDAKGAGECEERKLEDAANPRAFQLSAGTTRRLFELAADLSNFRSIDLDSHRKVANLGQKTLEYRQSREVNQVAFNHTENRAAIELVNTFEKIGTVEGHISSLEDRKSVV